MLTAASIIGMAEPACRPTPSIAIGAWDFGSACELEGVIPRTNTAYHVRGSARRGPQVCDL